MNQNSKLQFTVGKNKLIYDKANYPGAVDWVKTFEEGEYAYQNPVDGPDVLYGGARYMEYIGDEKILKEYGYMADVTFINPGMIGNEYVKSVGHYHGYVLAKDIAYPEIYEAVTDGIEYLLQSEPDANEEYDCLWVITQAGDKILMPPNWGHISMNVSDKPVVEIDVQKRDNPIASNYYPYHEKVGGAFYRTPHGIELNIHYKVKSLRIVKPKEHPQWGLVRNVPIYDAMVSQPQSFFELYRPQDYNFKINDFFEDIKPPFEVPLIYS